MIKRGFDCHIYNTVKIANDIIKMLYVVIKFMKGKKMWMHGMNYNHAYILIINLHPLMMCDFIQKI